MVVYKDYNLTIDTMINNKQTNVINFSQSDFGTAKLSITIKHNNQALDLTGTTVNIALLKKDKKKVYQQCTIKSPATSGIVETILSSQSLITPGIVDAELVIMYNDNTQISTNNFVINVEESIMSDDAIESTNEFPIIKKAIDAGEILGDVDLQTIVNNTTNVNNLKSEVENARGGFPNIDQRLDALDAEKPTMFQQEEEPLSAVEDDLWLDTSDNTYQGTKFEDLESQMTENTLEGTGYGVINGLLVEPQTWPIRDMTCQMSAGTVYMPNGKRFSFNSIGVIPIDVSHSTLNRRDIVYVSSSGVVSVLKGTNSSGDAIPPNAPNDGILLAIVTIKAGQTVIDTNVVQDKRYFKYNNNQLTDQLQNAKSSNALSIRPSEGIITKFLNNAQTYVKNVNKFAYGAPTAFYPGPIFTDENGKFRMNCSTFGHLMQKGIPFENSKYGGVPENIVDPNFNDIVPVTDDLFTYDFAKWAYDNGFGYVPDSDFKNVMPGDAIFFSWADLNAQLPKHSASFMNLDHTSMFVESNPDGSFVVYEDGNLPSLTTYPASYRAQVKYCCRLPFNSVDLDIKNIIVGGNIQVTVTGSSVVKTYNLSENLENHKWYTAVAKANIQTVGCWFNIYSGSTLLYSGKPHGIKPNGLYTFHFCTKGLDLSANNIVISLVAESETAVPSSTRNCVVDWFVLTPGFTNSIKEYVNGEKLKPTFTFTNGYTGSYKIYRRTGECVLSVKVTGAGSIASNALVTLGELSGITIDPNNHLGGNVIQELTAAPSYSNDATVWVDINQTPYRLRLRNGTTTTVNNLHILCKIPIDE